MPRSLTPAPMHVCPQPRRQYPPPLRMRSRMRRSCRRIRRYRHRRRGRPDRRQNTRRAWRRHRCPARHLPTSRPPPRSSPPHRRRPLSGTQAGHYPTRADRSDTVHNLLRAATDASCAVAARFSLEAFATRCNARRRRPDSVTPPIPGRPERPRAEPGTRPNQINGATARRSRVAARHLIPEIQLHYRHFRPPEGPTPHRSSAARLNPPAAPPAPSPATAAK